MRQVRGTEAVAVTSSPHRAFGVEEEPGDATDVTDDAHDVCDCGAGNSTGNAKFGARVRGFDRRWTIWSFVAVGVAALGWLIYGSSRQGLETYLQQLFATWPDNPAAADPSYLSLVASFSFASVAKFVLTVALAVALMSLILCGIFRGSKRCAS